MIKHFYITLLLALILSFSHINTLQSLSVFYENEDELDEEDESLTEELHLDQLTAKQNKIAYVVVDYNSGDVIAQHNAEEKWFPASITKIMTLYIVFDKLENKELTLDTPILISKKASQQEPVKLGLKAGSYILVKDAILAMSVKSANDVAYAIAEHIGGTMQGFTKLMNEKAKSIGMLNTNFANSTGLPDKNNYSTALDLARLGRSLMTVHNPYYVVFSVKSFSWDKYNYFNHNSFLLSYEEIDGIKTGFTNWSGRTSITSAQKNNARIITVALGFKSNRSRDVYIKKLTDYSLPLAKEVRDSKIAFVTKPDNLSNINDYIVLENKSNTEIYTRKPTNTANNNYLIHPSEYLNNLALSSYVNIKPFTLKKPIKDNFSSNNFNAVLQNASFVKPNIRIAKPTNITRASASNKNKTNTSKQKSKYTIQAGAFSSYKSALTAGMNILKIKGVSNNLRKSNISIEKSKSSNLYVLKFINLNQQIASSSCNMIKTKNLDCFVKI